MCDAAATSKLNFYMAFGRTGPGPLSMVGGDVTAAWIDKQLGLINSWDAHRLLTTSSKADEF